MSKTLRIFLKSVAIIAGVFVIVVGSLLLYVNFSPQPAVWLLRNQFSEEAEIQNTADYDDIRNKVVIYKNLVYPSEDERNV